MLSHFVEIKFSQSLFLSVYNDHIISTLHHLPSGEIISVPFDELWTIGLEYNVHQSLIVL